MTRKALLVEDSYLASIELESAVLRLGYNVLGPVATVEGALKLLAETPDIAFAVLDVRLRDGMCSPIVSKLVALGRPFILVTGYAKPELELGLSKGCEPILVRKPFSFVALKAAIEQVVDK